MAICPIGHDSATDDYCEVCGRLMAGTAPAPQGPPSAPLPPPPVGMRPYPIGASDPNATAPVELCPRCKTPREGQEPFCEGCRWNFHSGDPGQMSYPVPSNLPPAFPPGEPAPPPPSWSGAATQQPPYPPPPGQTPAPPLPPQHTGASSPPPPAPMGTHMTGAQGMPGPAGPGAQQPPFPPMGQPPGPPLPTPPVPQAHVTSMPSGPGVAGIPGQAPPMPPPTATTATPTPAGQQQASPPLGAPAGPAWSPSPAGSPAGPNAGQTPPAGTDFVIAPPSGQQEWSEPPTYGPQSAPPPTPDGAGLGTTSWYVIVSADRDYFTAMMARSGPEAQALFFPPFCPERRFDLVGNQLRIGRTRHRPNEEAPDIDLSKPPEDPGVSHKHAVLVQQPDGTWSVVDQESMNGTTINGSDEPVTAYVPIQLTDGDQIHVGAWTTITLHRG